MSDPRPADQPTISWHGDAAAGPAESAPKIEGYEVLGRRFTVVVAGSVYRIDIP